MDEFDFGTPITLGCAEGINHITFDGCWYYCTFRCKREIMRLDRGYRCKQRYCTRRQYDCICYDWCDRCFWASSSACCNTLYKLDCNMNEIDRISLANLGFSGEITGLSYHCCKDVLVVSFACAVVEVEKKTETTAVVYAPRRDWIMGVLSLCPGTLIWTLNDKKHDVQVLDAAYQKIGCYCIPEQWSVRDLVFNPCGKTADAAEIQALICKKHRYPYIVSHRVCADELGFIPCGCNDQICGACCGEEPPCGGGPACTDVVESVALVEAALSHILNTEAEKLEKVLARNGDIESILCANREVNQTIINATHLEQVLYAKLNAVTGRGCGEPCKEDCTPAGGIADHPSRSS